MIAAVLFIRGNYIIPITIASSWRHYVGYMMLENRNPTKKKWNDVELIFIVDGKE